MKILVTGANGRLGKIVRTQIDSRPELSPTYFVSPRSSPKSAADVKVDITNPADLKNAVLAAQPDTIVHLAGIAGAACDADPDLAEAANVNSMQVICDAAAASGTSRIVFASTAAVYGDQHTGRLNENHPLDLTSTYARTKFEAEKMLQTVTDATSLTGVALRIFNIYGDGFLDSLVYRLLSSTATAPLHLHGLDTFVRDYIHAPDVAEAVLRSATFPLQGNVVLNIGTGTGTSNRQLVRLLGSNAAPFKLAEPRSSYSCADPALSAELLDFSPPTISEVLGTPQA